MMRKLSPPYPWEISAAQQRRDLIGQLLSNESLSMTEIGRIAGVTPMYVGLIQRRYFPDSPRRCRFDYSAQAVERRRAIIGQLLRETSLSLTAIAQRVGITREGVRLIQGKYFPEFPRHKTPSQNGKTRSSNRDIT